MSKESASSEEKVVSAIEQLAVALPTCASAIVVFCARGTCQASHLYALHAGNQHQVAGALFETARQIIAGRGIVIKG